MSIQFRDTTLPTGEANAAPDSDVDSASVIDAGGAGAARAAVESVFVRAGGLGGVVARIAGGTVADLEPVGRTGRERLSSAGPPVAARRNPAHQITAGGVACDRGQRVNEAPGESMEAGAVDCGPKN